MAFPVYFNFFGHRIHPHMVMELLAYTGGSQLYFLLRRRTRQPTIEVEANLWLIVGCIFGALFGSKLLAWAESFPDYWNHRHELAAWMGGKTIVGGLLGGWIGVEIAKKRLGISRSTGDLFVFPLIFGMGVGRVGCFLTGLDDHTCGTHTALPWAVNFGDGPRHPTQLYEIAFLLLMGAAFLVKRGAWKQGHLFRAFLAGYLLFRLASEFIKPSWKPYAGLSAIQIACLLGAATAVWQMRPSQGGLRELVQRTGADTEPAGNGVG